MEVILIMNSGLRIGMNISCLLLKLSKTLDAVISQVCTYCNFIVLLKQHWPIQSLAISTALSGNIIRFDIIIELSTFLFVLRAIQDVCHERRRVFKQGVLGKWVTDVDEGPAGELIGRQLNLFLLLGFVVLWRMFCLSRGATIIFISLAGATGIAGSHRTSAAGAGIIIVSWGTRCECVMNRNINVINLRPDIVLSSSTGSSSRNISGYTIGWQIHIDHYRINFDIHQSILLGHYMHFLNFALQSRMLTSLLQSSNATMPNCHNILTTHSNINF